MELHERIPVVAIFDVGKTNKKLFLFDEQYRIVFEKTARFLEIKDEDGDACESLESLRLSIFDSLHELFRKKEFEVKAINFTAYGASLVYIKEDGQPITALYNYLKAYPKDLMEALHDRYAGEEQFCLETASPALGSLNSGLQAYRFKLEQPAKFEETTYILHLPQYLSFLLSGKTYSDMTSIGCHTALWDFAKMTYHNWVQKEGLLEKFPSIVYSDEVFNANFPGSTFKIGPGLHDSSAALIPYLMNFHEPFVLISTGTWCISLNPFNEDELSKDELDHDCLFYLSYLGKPVKASRLFAGYVHDVQAKRIADFYGVTPAKFRNLEIDWQIMEKVQAYSALNSLQDFESVNLSEIADYVQAYHALMLHLVNCQVRSTNLVLADRNIHRIFVDGGFSKNHLYMNLLSKFYPEIEVFAATIAQATALGAALVIHNHWNNLPIPKDLIQLRYFRS